MRRFTASWALVMAMLISMTSMGFAVSAHHCTSSGFSQTGLGKLKACCKHNEGKGIQAEPCCKLTVQHVKLPTVRGNETPVQWVLPIATIPVALPALDRAAQMAIEKFALAPPESPPLPPCPDPQASLCRFLI